MSCGLKWNKARGGDIDVGDECHGSTGETKDRERRSPTGAEFDRTWLGNDWIGCGEVVFVVGVEEGKTGSQEDGWSSVSTGLLEEKHVWSR